MSSSNLSILLVLIVVVVTNGLTIPVPGSSRATPEEFYQAALTATEGIQAALVKAATEIESAVTVEDPELAAKVHSILELAFNNARGTLIPALDSLGAATNDEEAEAIVVKTISDLMIIGLGTEFQIDDALIGASQEIHDTVKLIGATLTHDLKVQIRPLWDLVQATGRH